MKTSSIKRILSSVLCVALLLAVIFVISSCKKEHVHTFDEGVKVNATCTEDGSITKTCIECGEKEVTTISATGHSEVKHSAKSATCTEDGYKAYVTCKNCNYTTYSKISAKGHTEGSAVIDDKVEPTCTLDGSQKKVVYCVDCNEKLSSKDETLKATGHDYEVVVTAPTCTETGYTTHTCKNTDCGASYVDAETEMVEHAWVTVPALAATCLPGHYAYEKCPNCGEEKNFVEIAPAYDHIASEYPVEVKDTRVEPTCTEDGYYLEAICCTNDNCGKALSEVTERTLTKLGHDLYDVEKLEPTCVDKGHEAHERCTRCDYSTSVEIPEVGHTSSDEVEENRVEPTCTEIGGFDMVVYCSVCEEELNRRHEDIDALDHDYVAHEGKPNSCTEDGWVAYDTCTRCDYTTYEDLPKTGHDEGECQIENLVEPTCTEFGSYDRVFYCLTCEVEVRRENWEVDLVAHNDLGRVDAKEPTCTEIGWYAYSCCSKCGYTESYVEIPALGHDLTKHDAKAVGCENIGWAAYEECNVCDYTTYEEIPATGHNIKVVEAVAPTCLESGNTEDRRCLNCGDVYAEYSVLKALGHNYGANGYCQNNGCNDRISVGITFELNSNGGYTFTGIDNCTDTELIIPSEINGVPVTAIAENALKNNSTVKSVIIPDSVKTIGTDAFYNCEKLEKVTIGNGVTEIGKCAFFFCRNLTSVTLGSNVKTIGENAFNYTAISVVNYNGTSADWNKISIGSNNDKLTGANRYYI